MPQLPRFLLLLAALSTAIFLGGCGSSSMHAGSGSGGATGGSGSGSSGSGSGSSSGGAGAAIAVAGFGAGTGASGQKSAARFLYANPLPSGGPDAALIHSNGTLTLQAGGSANNADPMTMAIDPSGSFLFQTTQGGFNGSTGGLFVFAINRTNGTLGPR